MFTIFLQADSTVAAASSAQVETVWGMLTKGGPLMIPLFILFALAVFFYGIYRLANALDAFIYHFSYRVIGIFR